MNKERLLHFKRQAITNLRAIPPSKNGLIEHVKRACLQGGWLWKECVENVVIPNPTDWGWKKLDEQLVPVWQNSENCLKVEKLVETCTCKTGKCKNCKCRKNNVECLLFCDCERNCHSR